MTGAPASAASEAAAPEPEPRKGKISSRNRDERRLGWMLCAPAVIAMLAVTAYPIIYAVVLSVQEFDLRFPEDKGFAGLGNYATVLSSGLWWTDVFNTLFVTVISVIGSFQVFDQVYLVTGNGGPGTATYVYNLHLFNEGFTFFRMGYAAALAYVLFAILFIITFIQLRIGRQRASAAYEFE